MATPKIWFLKKEFFGNHINLRGREKFKTQLYKMVENAGESGGRNLMGITSILLQLEK